MCMDIRPQAHFSEIGEDFVVDILGDDSGG